MTSPKVQSPEPKASSRILFVLCALRGEIRAFQPPPYDLTADNLAFCNAHVQSVTPCLPKRRDTGFEIRGLSLWSVQRSALSRGVHDRADAVGSSAMLAAYAVPSKRCRRSGQASLGPLALAQQLADHRTGLEDSLSVVETLEHAQQIAAHASPKTTKLYDRTADTIALDEIERIVI